MHLPLNYLKQYSEIYLLYTALVKLSRPLNWSISVKPVCLPNDNQEMLSFNMTGLKCVATGQCNNLFIRATVVFI